MCALNGLKANGYKLDFNIAFDKIICQENGLCLNPNEFEVARVYRFEGATNPDDEDISYAIESKDGTIKSSMTSAYELYADIISNEMVQKLSMH